MLEAEAPPGIVQQHDFSVSDTDRGARLDVFLATKLADMSRAQVQRLITTSAVLVNGAPVKVSHKVEAGDLVLVSIAAPRPSHMLPQAIDLDIVFEDADLLVVNKPKGMVVHPAPGAQDSTLVNALLAHCTDLSGIGGEERPGIVHRLDKDTSGLLMVAKNDVAHNGLQSQIQRRTASRRYAALLWGRPAFIDAEIDAPIARHPTDRKRMTVVSAGTLLSGRSALTHLHVLESLGPITLAECTLATGRTHQIRVHCQFANFPVVGDPVYGGLRKVGSEWARGDTLLRLNDAIASLHGQALHAWKLSFTHPRTGAPMSFELPMPDEMASLIALLKEAGR